tara:strand:- start:102 stop:224 length:123 start_codon:yes stop_codon:yes gene_type:complete
MASISATFLGLPLAIVINGLVNDRFKNVGTYFAGFKERNL